MKHKKIILVVGLFLVISIIYAFIPPIIPHNPIGQLSFFQSQNQKQSNLKYRVFGFLPYWNIKKVTAESSKHLTDVIYFALNLDSKGNIQKYDNSREENPGWTQFQRYAASATQDYTLAIQMLDNDDISLLLSSESSRLNAINNLLSLISTYNLRGINIDFEPTGSVSETTRNNFTKFVEELAASLNKNKLSGVELSVDIYPTLYGKQRLWDIPRISPHLAYVVVMGYDYHYRGSDTAGPVSPLRGATAWFNDDLVTNLGEISRLIPANKIILGLPFYGYRWATITTDKYSRTIGSGITTPLEDINQLIKDDPTTLHWDRNSLTPYLVLENNNKISQIYFENDLSFGLKLDLVVSSEYRGIAIWALGYEGERNPLWQTISNKLNVK